MGSQWAILVGDRSLSWFLILGVRVTVVGNRSYWNCPFCPRLEICPVSWYESSAHRIRGGPYHIPIKLSGLVFYRDMEDVSRILRTESNRSLRCSCYAEWGTFAGRDEQKFCPLIHCHWSDGRLPFWLYQKRGLEFFCTYKGQMFTVWPYVYVTSPTECPISTVQRGPGQDTLWHVVLSHCSDVVKTTGNRARWAQMCVLC